MDISTRFASIAYYWDGALEERWTVIPDMLEHQAPVTKHPEKLRDIPRSTSVRGPDSLT